MDSNGGLNVLPEWEVTSLEFHLALLNKAHETMPDAEILEYCMWLIPFISTAEHLWWSIYPSDQEGIELCSGNPEETFIVDFHKEYGFVKLHARILHQETDNDHNSAKDVTIDFIDVDKVPMEYPGMKEFIAQHVFMSQKVFAQDPNWKLRMIQQDIPFYLA
jgi:hypothetical protein